MNLTKLLILVCILASCKGREPVRESELLAQYAGHYKITSFKSDIAVDLNDDQVSSHELVNEIDGFDFEDLEIRPHPDTDNSTKFISLFLPKTDLTFQFPNHPQGYPRFVKYGFGTRYTLEAGKIKLEENTYIEKSRVDNEENNRTVTMGEYISLIDAYHLKASVAKEYYDFKDKRWKLLNIEILFEKAY